MYPHLAIDFGSLFGHYSTFHTQRSVGRKKLSTTEPTIYVKECWFILFNNEIGTRVKRPLDSFQYGLAIRGQVSDFLLANFWEVICNALQVP